MTEPEMVLLTLRHVMVKTYLWWTKHAAKKRKVRDGWDAALLVSTSAGLGRYMFQEAPAVGKILLGGRLLTDLLDAWPTLPLTRWKAPSIIQYHHASSEHICFRTSWITRSFDRRRSLCRDERDVEKNGWHMMARGKRRMLLTGLINVTCYLLENKYDIGNTTI